MADHRVAGKFPPLPASVRLSATGTLRRSRLDGEPGARARAKFGEEGEQALLETVFRVEQIVRVAGRVALEDAGGGLDVFALQPAARVAGRDAHARAVADAL